MALDGLPPASQIPLNIDNFFGKNYFVNPLSSDLSTTDKVKACFGAFISFITGLTILYGLYALTFRATPASDCSPQLKAESSKIAIVAGSSYPPSAPTVVSDKGMFDALHPTIVAQEKKAGAAIPYNQKLIDQFVIPYIRNNNSIKNPVDKKLIEEYFLLTIRDISDCGAKANGENLIRVFQSEFPINNQVLESELIGNLKEVLVKIEKETKALESPGLSEADQKALNLRNLTRYAYSQSFLTDFVQPQIRNNLSLQGKQIELVEIALQETLTVGGSGMDLKEYLMKHSHAIGHSTIDVIVKAFDAFQKEYLEKVYAENPSLKQFLEAHLSYNPHLHEGSQNYSEPARFALDRAILAGGNIAQNFSTNLRKNSYFEVHQGKAKDLVEEFSKAAAGINFPQPLATAQGTQRMEPQHPYNVGGRQIEEKGRYAAAAGRPAEMGAYSYVIAGTTAPSYPQFDTVYQLDKYLQDNQWFGDLTMEEKASGILTDKFKNFLSTKGLTPDFIEHLAKEFFRLNLPDYLINPEQ